MAGCDIILYTATGKPANVNNSGGNRTFITYRRASQKMAHSSLAVTEICVIIASKVLQFYTSMSNNVKKVSEMVKKNPDVLDM